MLFRCLEVLPHMKVPLLRISFSRHMAYFLHFSFSSASGSREEFETFVKNLSGFSQIAFAPRPTFPKAIRPPRNHDSFGFMSFASEDDKSAAQIRLMDCPLRVFCGVDTKKDGDVQKSSRQDHKGSKFRQPGAGGFFDAPAVPVQRQRPVDEADHCQHRKHQGVPVSRRRARVPTIVGHVCCIDGLAFGVTNDNLYHMLRVMGHIYDITRHERMAIIYFAAPESVTAAISAFNGSTLEGNTLVVSGGGSIKVPAVAVQSHVQHSFVPRYSSSEPYYPPDSAVHQFV